MKTTSTDFTNWCRFFSSTLQFCLLLFMVIPITTNAQVHSRADIYSFSANERCELRNLMVTFLSANSGSVPLEHQMPAPYDFWEIHCYNEFFMSWHREYIRRMEEWLLTQPGGSKYVPLPSWDPEDTIPDEFFNSVASGCSGSAIASGSTSFINLNNQFPATDPMNPYDFSNFLNPLTICNFSSGNRTRPCPIINPGMPNWNAVFGTAIDNFGWSLEVEHDAVHRATGGIMGTAVSPASAIFWLWHAYVDDIYRLYQCECQSDTPKDLYIADSNEDLGNEPNTETPPAIYLSPEIWVRTTQDGIGADGRYLEEDNPLRHENPEAGQTNYIYVRIRNIGCETVQAGESSLRVYYSKASTGLQWPVHWNNYMNAGLTYGDEVTQPPNTTGAISIPQLGPGEQYVAEIPWTNVPDPADFSEVSSHFCLLARLESTVDPMVLETTSVGANTRNNNNIAWKNLEIVNLNPFMFTTENTVQAVFEVIQPANNIDPIKLTFKKAGDFKLDGIYISSNPAVMDTFLLQAQTTGMELTDDPITGDPAYWIFGDSASMEGLMLSPGSTVPVSIRFQHNCDQQGGVPCANFGDINRFDVQQFQQGVFGEEFTGAVGYEIRTVLKPEDLCDPPLIQNLIIEQPECANTPNGYIGLELAGEEPYSIYWSNNASVPEITNLLPGSYGVTIVDNSGCIDTMNFDLKDRSDLQISFEAISPYCSDVNSMANGVIEAIVTGGTPPYLYEWSNESQEATIVNLSFGEYTLTVTDAQQCQRIKTIYIGTVMPLSGSVSGENASSAGANDGSATVRANGGEPPYAYQWSNGATDKTIEELSPGDYTVTITDVNGCSFLATITIDVTNAVQEVFLEEGVVEIYPNPVQKVIHVDTKEWPARSLNVVISDASGKVIRSTIQPVKNNWFMMDVRTLPPGMYYLHLKEGARVVSQKFIKVE